MGELTDEQVDRIYARLKRGNDLINDNPDAALEGVPMCDALDSIIEHLETVRVEIALGFHTDDGRDPDNLTHMAMHWGVILGAGIALSVIDEIMSHVEDEDSH